MVHQLEFLVPQPGIKPVLPALEVWSLNHWTSRGALLGFLSDSDEQRPATNLHWTYNISKNNCVKLLRFWGIAATA